MRPCAQSADLCAGKTTFLQALKQQVGEVSAPLSSNNVSFDELVLDDGGRATQVQLPKWQAAKSSFKSHLDGRLRLLTVDMPGQLQ